MAVDLDDWILAPASGYEDVLLDDYDDEGNEEQELEAEHEAHVAGAVRTLEGWLDHVRSEESSNPLERYVNRTLARDAIRVLRRRLSTRGIEFCDALLEFEPQMTHTVCRYLSRVGMVDSAAIDFVAQLVARPDIHLSVWQQLWLLEPLLWSRDAPSELWDWVTPMLDNYSSPLLRARAALVLATHEQISTVKLGNLFDESTSAAKPDLVVAMKRAGADESVIRSVADENELLRYVLESVD